MNTAHIRRQFLKYFKEQQHAVISSSPVIPHDDPTLLFTNAGMNQFKDVFLGKSIRDYNRAVTSQKCIRAGGKHNDLDNVGHTKRHLTFFEMLGNFSFGDYFKEQAIKWAWEVSLSVFQLDPKSIWPTVYQNDDEAFEIWTRYVPAEKITRFGEKENFWAMGETGPCGPCSELLYDRGPDYGSATNPHEDPEGNRFLEYWNLVFMQFNRQDSGVMNPLPRPSIDTGAGIERVVSLAMDVDSVFETDVLRSLIAQVENVSKKVYDPRDHHTSAAFRVIADHLRSLSFAIADGAQPSNVDRGYVLRKILRRAVRYGRNLGFEDPFLAKILPRLVTEMGEDYPELVKGQERIAELLTVEEEAFFRTLHRGGNMLSQIMERAKNYGNTISGDDAFKLKDTYGLPVEEILLMAKDSGLVVDQERYQELDILAKERSRSVQKTTKLTDETNLFAQYFQKQGPCYFLGYTHQSASAKITAIIVNGAEVDTLCEGQEGLIILDQTPFYAEMGGQVGDTGTLKSEGEIFEVSDCQSPFKGVIAHLGTMKKGEFHTKDQVTATIDTVRRQNIENNHTATHLLHWALQQVLGEHIKQAGSVVDPLRLRFDFSHHKALTQNEIYAIEDLVNAKIREDLAVQWYELSYEEAQKREDIKQFFGEKYGAKVRVIDIDYSKELCGGTHTKALGKIGLFRIAKESSIAAGVRRIEAVTGKEAEQLARASELHLEELAALLKSQPVKLKTRIEKLLEENKLFTRELNLMKQKEQQSIISSLLSEVQKKDDFHLLIKEIICDPSELRNIAELLLQALHSAVVVLVAANEERCQLVIRISDDLVKKGIQANEMIKSLIPIIGGSGGGKPNHAQAAGKSLDKIPEVLKQANLLIQAYV